MALLKSTNVIGNLSATGNIIASKFILNGGDNNSLLLAGGNTKLVSDFATSAQMTAANTSINNLSSGKVNKAGGDTMTGPLTNTHVSTTWLNSCNGNSAYNVGYGSYTGWINGYTKNGRMAISTYPGNDNKLYFIYMNNDTITAGTNSTNAAMTWDGGTNTLTATTFTGALSGNASSATQLATARSIFGKNFNGTANVEGQALVYGSYNATTGSRYSTGGLQIRENGLVGSAQSDIAYAPAIGFHWGNRVAASLLFHSDGNFYFRKQNFTDRATIDANLNGNAATATKATQDGDGNTIKDTYLKLSGGTVTGTLILSKTQDLSGTANNKPALIIGGTDTTTHIEIDSNEIQAKETGTTVGPLYLNNDGGLVNIGSGGLSTKGNITPNANNTKTLGTSSLKWSNVYATTFTGALSGNASTATKATQDSDGSPINTTYLKLSGGTLSGPLTFVSGQWNLVGDDAMIGDQNIAGAFCIKGNNGATTIRMYSYDANVTTTANFQYNTSDKCIDVIFN